MIVLDQNYRSTQRILDAANAVIANNAARRPKHLWTEQVGGELDHPLPRRGRARRGRVRRARDRPPRRRPSDHRFGDVAVFYRTNAQSRVIEEPLVRAGVPYRVFGGVKFYDRREVKDAARVPARAGEPRRRSVSGSASSTRRKRGVGDTSVERRSTRTRRARASRSATRSREAAAAGVTGKALGGIERPARAHGRRSRTRRRRASAPTVEAVLEQTGYLAELEAERSIEAQGRIENLQELVGVCREFDEQLDAGDVTGLPGDRRRRHRGRDATSRRRASRRARAGAGVPRGDLARHRPRHRPRARAVSRARSR